MVGAAEGGPDARSRVVDLLCGHAVHHGLGYKAMIL